MKGRDVIKAIIDAGGLDAEYEFTPIAKKKPGRKKSEPLTRVEIDAENGLVTLFVSDPIKAFSSLKLSDKYRKYVWDGESMYFYKDPDGVNDWNISFGGGSTTLIAESAKKYRDAAVKIMVEAASNEYKKGKSVPSWIMWRVSHFRMGKPGLSVFE